MSCASCAHHIEKSVSKIPGVISCEVNFATETAKVNFDESIVNFDQIKAVVKPLGYTLLEPIKMQVDPLEIHHNTSSGDTTPQ